MLRAIETIDVRGNITRHAAAPSRVTVLCGRAGRMRNHPEATIPSRPELIQCGRCRNLLTTGSLTKRRRRAQAPMFRFRRQSPPLML
jgi:hypothetical protein